MVYRLSVRVIAQWSIGIVSSESSEDTMVGQTCKAELDNIELCWRLKLKNHFEKIFMRLPQLYAIRLNENFQSYPMG